MSSPPKTAKPIFLEAIEAHDPEQWPAFLDQACGDDAQLRHRVEVLLEAHLEDSCLIDNPAVQPATTLQQAPAETVGTRIGPYKLRELLGEGGMGSVFVAEQEQPVRRKVALKIIKPGMDSHQVLTRFEAERQTLALMDHPNIAKVLDAGTTDSGRPYFVMELVRGVPITEFCDRRRLNPRQRLELFIQVCRAIQHAHQKGIIHRDIKPTNILVTLHDDLAVPKVIDFGIAKATGERLTEQTVYTAFNQLIGTPLYMSPEQAEMNALDVDTRSDVYSLGVLLYELLTGSTPFDTETLRQAGFDEMRRLIREVDPPRPSQRVSTLDAQAASTVSQSRGVDERHLHRALRGDLDWIVMKALEKDRNRRYESASALAADVQRHLDNEPIQAKQPRLFTSARKWSRRHRTATTAATVAAILLLMVATGAAADRHRQVREATRFVETSLQAARTALEADDVKQAALRLSEAQTRIDSDRLKNEALVEDVATLLQEAERYTKFVPLVEKARFDRSDEEVSIAPAEEALALYGVLDKPKWLESLRAAGLPEAHIKRVTEGAYKLLLLKADHLVRWSSKWPESERQTRRERQTQQALEYLNKAISFHAPSRGYYWLLANCALIQNDAGRATRLRKTALETPPQDAAELFYISRDRSWGTVSHDRGYPEYSLEECYKDHREMLRLDPTYYNGLFFMGIRLSEARRYAEALPIWYACVARRPDDTVAICNRGIAHLKLEQYDEAIADAGKVIELAPGVIEGWTLRGLAYEQLKQFDKAVEDFAHAVDLKSGVWFALDRPANHLAWLLATAPVDKLRDGKRAVELATKACELTEYKHAGTVDTLAAAYAEAGDFEAAVKWAEKALELTDDNDSLRETINKHLDSYRAGKPWREQ